MKVHEITTFGGHLFGWARTQLQASRHSLDMPATGNTRIVREAKYDAARHTPDKQVGGKPLDGIRAPKKRTARRPAGVQTVESVLDAPKRRAQAIACARGDLDAKEIMGRGYRGL